MLFLILWQDLSQVCLKKQTISRFIAKGSIDDLTASRDKAGVEIAVVSSIATRPEQFQAIMGWSISITSPRIVHLTDYFIKSL
ncbi:MAG: hypothetical protein CSA32_00295 [Desulfobulbus propionicus]|nr:MAG: hypothetical protein CSA32_00295 [Desulfobulbus propionicus]